MMNRYKKLLFGTAAAFLASVSLATGAVASLHENDSAQTLKPVTYTGTRSSSITEEEINRVITALKEESKADKSFTFNKGHAKQFVQALKNIRLPIEPQQRAQVLQHWSSLYRLYTEGDHAQKALATKVYQNRLIKQALNLLEGVNILRDQALQILTDMRRYNSVIRADSFEFVSVKSLAKVLLKQKKHEGRSFEVYLSDIVNREDRAELIRYLGLEQVIEESLIPQELIQRISDITKVVCNKLAFREQQEEKGIDLAGYVDSGLKRFLNRYYHDIRKVYRGERGIECLPRNCQVILNGNDDQLLPTILKGGVLTEQDTAIVQALYYIHAMSDDMGDLKASLLDILGERLKISTQLKRCFMMRMQQALEPIQFSGDQDTDIQAVIHMLVDNRSQATALVDQYFRCKQNAARK
jgi:hypothetical protein